MARRALSYCPRDGLAITSRERVKAIYKKHCGVAVTPKDLRSIYVTFLKEGDHGEEALRAAAEKMRHTTKMQGSAAYDKSNKLAQTAVAMATNYSAKFRAQ